MPKIPQLVQNALCVICIVSLITLLFWFIIESYNETKEYVITNQCDLTGQVQIDPYFWCDGNGVCSYSESREYEYFCNVTKETKWFMFKIDRNQPV